jgi:hypothetical protein
VWPTGSGEPHVDLDLVARERLLVARPALVVTHIALGCRQAVHLETLEDPPDPRRADLDVVVPGEIHRDLVRAKVVALAQVDDLADDLGLGRTGDVVRA